MSGPTKPTRRRSPSFFDAETRVVDIGADLLERLEPTEDLADIATQVSELPRFAAGSNPPMPIEPTQIRLINPDNEPDTDPTAVRLHRFEAVEDPGRAEQTELRPLTRPSGPYCPVGAPQLAAYQIVRKIAVGGMGIVYEAYHRASGKRVAVKYMRRIAADKPDLVQRFLAEAVAASRIEHPGVAEIYDYGHDDNGVPYLVIEYLEGECLAARLAREPLGIAELAAIAAHIALILEAAHRCGIVHRDLKPDNIFLLAGDGPLQLKVLDFGVAKFQNNDLFLRATRTGQMLGTPYYMSPEQCAGARIDRRSDIYALGCVMYQMLTGRVPFAGNLIAVVTGHRNETPTPIAALNHAVPASLIALVDRMMAKAPGDRPQSMAEVAGALGAVSAQAPVPRQPTPEPAVRIRTNLVDTIDSIPGSGTPGEPAPVARTGRAVRAGLPLALVLAAAAALALAAYLM